LLGPALAARGGAARLTAAHALVLHAFQVAAPAPCASPRSCDEPLSPRLLVLRDSAAYGAHDWAQWRPRRDAALAVRGGCRAVALGGAQAAQRCVRALARTCEGAPSRRRRPRRAGPPSVPPHCQSMFVRPMRAAACAPSRRRCSICCTTRLWAAARRRERSARTARLVLRTTPAPRRGSRVYRIRPHRQHVAQL
jgi:hypothetical protein